MTYGRLLGQYKKVDVETAGKIDLVVMCYEKATEMIWQAKKLCQEKRIEEKARRLQKAMDIVNQLQVCLNFEKGGQIAKNLDSIYTYLTRRLLEGDIKKDLAAFDEAIHILDELRDAWQKIASEGEAEVDKIAIPHPTATIMRQIAA